MIKVLLQQREVARQRLGIEAAIVMEIMACEVCLLLRCLVGEETTLLSLSSASARNIAR